MTTAFFNLGAPEIILIVFVVLLLFGGKKIPELMKGLGKGVRSFRQGMSEYFICTLKHFVSDRVCIVEVLAHTHKLSSLSGKN